MNQNRIKWTPSQVKQSFKSSFQNLKGNIAVALSVRKEREEEADRLLFELNSVSDRIDNLTDTIKSFGECPPEELLKAKETLLQTQTEIERKFEEAAQEKKSANQKLNICKENYEIFLDTRPVSRKKILKWCQN